MNFDYIKLTQKGVLDAIRSKQVVYSLTMSGKKKDEVSNHLSYLMELCKVVGDKLSKEKLSLDQRETRQYLRSPEIPDTQYYVLSPQLMGGYSPFVMFDDSDGKSSTHSGKGVLVKMSLYKYVYCPKTIKALTNELFTEQLREGMVIPMKEARKQIVESLKVGNPHNVPLVEKVSNTTFYIDAEKGIVLCKSSKSDLHAIRAFFALLEKLAKTIFAETELEAKIEKLVDNALKETFYPEPFSTSAIGDGLSAGAYNISSMVAYYAENQTEGADACAVLPTHTANAYAKNNSDQSVRFKNSIGLFSGKESEEAASFDNLDEFREKMELDYSSLTVIGELPVSRQLEAYFEMTPEARDEWGAHDFISVSFETAAKDGNVCFQLKENTKPFEQSCRALLLAHAEENSVSPERSEEVLLQFFGGMLSLLHDSADLFIKLYLDSTKIPETFGKEHKEAA